MPGAEPFDFPRDGPEGRTGVLLVHGFTGTPMSLRPWGEHLAAAGFAVRCPLLPGHGTRWQDCNVSTHDQWTTAVERGVRHAGRRLRPRLRRRAVDGRHAATRLAEARPDDVAGLILVNPALLTQRLDAKLLPLIARMTGSWAPIASDIKKPGVVELAYPKLPTRAMLQLRQLWAATRADLARVTAPTIVFHSVEDHVVEPVNSQILLDGIGSTDITEVVLRDSYHVATLDNDAPTIFEGSVDWIRGRGSPPARPPSADGERATRRGAAAATTGWTPPSGAAARRRPAGRRAPARRAAGGRDRRLPGAVGGRRAVHPHRLPAQPAARTGSSSTGPAGWRPATSSTSTHRPGRRRAGSRRPPSRTGPERAAVRPDLDEDAEWARIVAGLRGRARPPGGDRRALRRPTPAPHEPAILDRPDEHFEPPPPPPIPAPAPPRCTRC